MLIEIKKFESIWLENKREFDENFSKKVLKILLEKYIFFNFFNFLINLRKIREFVIK